jgi:hypothetical protein
MLPDDCGAVQARETPYYKVGTNLVLCSKRSPIHAFAH